jgi:hypothetical protein
VAAAAPAKTVADLEANYRGVMRVMHQGVGEVASYIHHNAVEVVLAAAVPEAEVEDLSARVLACCFL